MKRIVALVLCVVLMVGLIAGCGKGGVKKGDGSTLKIGLCTSALIEDYDTNMFTKWIEEQSGYKIEFQFFSSQSSEAKSQIATMIAAGEELPDILWGVDFGKEVYTEYGDDGYFLDLKEYFDDKKGASKVFWDRFAELPEEDQDRAMRNMVNPDSGAMYALPTLQYSEIDVMDYMMFINQDWLNKLGLSMPNSLEELYNVLVAFRDRDPNGNGRKDEIPFIGCNSLSGHVINYILNQFLYFNEEKSFGIKDGKLTTPFTSNEYREGLKYANKLVNEGLLSSLSLTTNATTLKGYICPTTDASGNINDSDILVGCFVGHPTLVIEPNNPALYKYTAMNYWSNSVITNNQQVYRTFITEDCEDPDAAWNFLMNFYTEEASLRLRYGEKGVDWDDADEGTKSFIGYDAQIKVINQVWANQNNSTWGNIQSTILYYAENEVTQIEDVSKWQDYLNKQFTATHDNYFAAAEKYNPKEKLSAIVLTTEESEQYSMTISNCKSHISNSRTSFVTGTLNPNSDSDWNEYLKKLDDLGLKTWLSVAQKAYDRQNNLK
ncbi:MAG: extracellular solute-binding protein [Clostridia bacterium]|nr:extracellular solute-binding protein [Clostridia bacterium]